MADLENLKQIIRTRRIKAIEQANEANKVAKTSIISVFKIEDMEKIIDKIDDYIDRFKIDGTVGSQHLPYLQTQFQNLLLMYDNLDPNDPEAFDDESDLDNFILKELEHARNRLRRNRPPAFDELLEELYSVRIDEGQSLYEQYDDLMKKYPENDQLYSDIYNLYSELQRPIFKDMADNKKNYKGRKTLTHFIEQKVRDIVDVNDEELLKLTKKELEQILNDLDDTQAQYIITKLNDVDKKLVEKRDVLGHQKYVDDLINDLDYKERPKKKQITPRELNPAQDKYKQELDDLFPVFVGDNVGNDTDDEDSEYDSEDEEFEAGQGTGSKIIKVTRRGERSGNKGYRSMITPSQNIKKILMRKQEEHKRRVTKRYMDSAKSAKSKKLPEEKHYSHVLPKGSKDYKGGLGSVFPAAGKTNSCQSCRSDHPNYAKHAKTSTKGFYGSAKKITKKGGTAQGPSSSDFLDVAIPPKNGGKKMIPVAKSDRNYALTKL